MRILKKILELYTFSPVIVFTIKAGFPFAKRRREKGRILTGFPCDLESTNPPTNSLTSVNEKSNQITYF